MRSIYVRTILWCLGTLAIALIALFVVSNMIVASNMGLGDLFQRLQRFDTTQAVAAWESGGRPGLTKFVAQVDLLTRGRNYLVDAAGRDLATGQDRSALLVAVRGKPDRPVRYGDDLLAGAATDDGRYTLVTVVNPPFEPARFLGYYLGILATVAFLSWLLAFNLVRPIRMLSATVDRFGHGDMSARAHLRRQDEIGDLARSFDSMADRIAALLSAERRLLTDVSHELRTPLTRLGFAAELARTAEDREDAAARIRKEIAHLSSLVGSLLEVTRAEGDASARARQFFSLNSLVSHVVDDCRFEADEQGCEIAIIAFDPVNLTGDPGLLRSAVENVMRNAIRYSPAAARIEIAVRWADQSARVTVRDWGPGVPEDMLPRIFEPFYRVDESRVNSTGGVGLGLSIASRAVELHSGTITAENANPGLRVTITIPGVSR